MPLNDSQEVPCFVSAERVKEITSVEAHIQEAFNACGCMWRCASVRMDDEILMVSASAMQAMCLPSCVYKASQRDA